MPILAVAFLGLAAQSAYAHHPHVASAKAVCVNGVPSVFYDIISWDPGSVFGPTMSAGALGPNDGNNTDIQVLFNGNVVDNQPFTTVPPHSCWTNLPGRSPHPQAPLRLR